MAIIKGTSGWLTYGTAISADRFAIFLEDAKMVFPAPKKWVCSYCGALHSDGALQCSCCGGPRDGHEKTF